MSSPDRKSRSTEAILEAAIGLFSTLGYDGTNFRQITEQCGASRSLILYHFRSKEELWRTAVECVCQRFSEGFRQRLAIGDELSDAERMRVALRAFVDTLVDVPEYGRILLREGCTPSPRLDWIVLHFAPPSALNIRFRDPTLNERIRRSLLRDVITAALLAVTALGPLLDASLAAALRQDNAGIYPLTDDKRDELINMLMRLALPKAEAMPAATA